MKNIGFILIVKYLNYYLLPGAEKIIMERINWYFKKNIENIDDYYLCIKKKEMKVSYCMSLVLTVFLFLSIAIAQHELMNLKLN